jgi:2-isopropylmalate synthase
VGQEQVVAVGPMSGKSNVTWFLEKHGVQPTEERVQKVLDLAKQTPRLLTDAEILAAASNG